jgi:dTDP-4-amino-4,6-dideoxygalactose transaminase
MIRFNLPSIVGREFEYLTAAVEAGKLSSSGPFATRCSALLRDALHAQDVLMTTSCTDALEMSALMLDLGPGDTVIVPSFTFTSTALAFARQGVNLRFADIEPVTFGIDPASVESLLDDTVRAVVCVHYGGVPCDIDGLMKLLDAHPGVDLIEDNAHCLFGTHGGEPLGSFGRFSTLSFHETKNFQCGEGGALVVNDPADVDRAHVLFDKGTNRRAFMLGEVDKYSWKDTGSSFGMSDLQGAFLFAQLEQHEYVLRERGRVDALYRELFAPYVERLGIALPVVPVDCESAFHMFYVMTPNRAVRDQLLAGCKERGVNPTFHYVPLHSSDAGRRFSDRAEDCPVTNDVSDRLLRMPFYTTMTDDDVRTVVSVVVDVLKPLVGS